MRFRSPREDLEAPPSAAEQEAARVQSWQRQRLGRLGFDPGSAARIVTAAWDEGDHAEFVHRIEDLVAQGATLDQAARICAPIGPVIAHEGAPSMDASVGGPAGDAHAPA